MYYIRKIALAGAALLLSSTIALAESSITYQSDAAKPFDKKIAAAALAKAIEKIGDLRGSLDGLDQDHIVTAQELKDYRSTSLGFPRMQEDIITGTVEKAIPIV